MHSRASIRLSYLRPGAARSSSRPSLEAIPNLKSLWQAKSAEDLEIALDKAQSAILEALQGDDPQTQLNAATLMLRSRQARERGWS